MRLRYLTTLITTCLLLIPIFVSLTAVSTETSIRSDQIQWIDAAFVNILSAAESGATIDVEVQAIGITKNDDNTLSRQPIADAWVELHASAGTLGALWGSTDANGKFRTTFTVPTTTQDSGVLINIFEVSKTGYDSFQGYLQYIATYPTGSPFLAVQMSSDNTFIDDVDSVGGMGETNILVDVTDQSGTSVAAAEIEFTVSPGGPNFSWESTQTNSNGGANTNFIAYDLGDNSTTWYESFTVTANASKDGYSAGTQSIKITINDNNADRDSDFDGTPDNLDTDDDGDNFKDDWEVFMGTDPLDPADYPLDTDGDGDPDGDANNTWTWMDDDDDDDGYLDSWEKLLGTDPLDDSSHPLDTDDDGKPDGDANNTAIWMDTDDDGDGIEDSEDDNPKEKDGESNDGGLVSGNGDNTMIIIAVAVCVIVGIAVSIFIIRKN